MIRRVAGGLDRLQRRATVSILHILAIRYIYECYVSMHVQMLIKYLSLCTHDPAYVVFTRTYIYITIIYMMLIYKTLKLTVGHVVALASCWDHESCPVDQQHDDKMPSPR